MSKPSPAKRLVSILVGALVVVVGAAGVALSVVAVAQTWTLADRLGRQVPEVLGHLEELVDSIRQHGESTASLLETARDRVRSVSEAAEELVVDRSDEPAAAPSILGGLERDIEQRLETAEEFILAMQDSIRSMSNALMLLDALPFFRTRIAPDGGPPEGQLKYVASRLSSTVSLLDQATLTLTRIRSGQTLTPRQLAQFRETLDQVDRGLLDAQAEVRLFTSRVERTGSQVLALRDGIPDRLHQGSLLITGFFVCFGFSQLSLAAQGLRLLKGPGRSKVDWSEGS